MPFISEIVWASPMISSARSAWSATARARSHTSSVSANRGGLAVQEHTVGGDEHVVEHDDRLGDRAATG